MDSFLLESSASASQAPTPGRPVIHFGWKSLSYGRNSDDKLYCDVCQALLATGRSMRHVTPEVTCGCVKLTGCVSTFYEKQKAQQAVMELSGVLRVDNQLVVI